MEFSASKIKKIKLILINLIENSLIKKFSPNPSYQCKEPL